jgi:hypothetical protein
MKPPGSSYRLAFVFLARGFTDLCPLLAFRFGVDVRFAFAFFIAVRFVGEARGSLWGRL